MVLFTASRVNALVVGASQGIGLGFVKKLLLMSQVDKLFATYRDRASASELLALQEQYPDTLICIATDVTNETEIAHSVECIQQQVSRLHLVINCVGLLHDAELQPEKSLRQINSDHLIRYFQVNSIASVLLAKHLLSLLSHPEPSVFACISAKVGSIGDNHLGGWYGYRASKAALNMLMKTVAIEYRRKSPHTIVVLLHPGTTDTRLSQPFQRGVPPEKLFTVDRTVEQLLTVISTLNENNSGQFFSWDGTQLPW